MPPILDPSAYVFGTALVITLDLSPVHVQKSSGSRLQFCEQSLEITHACSGCDALRPDYKFGRAAQNVVILMIDTPGPWSIFATRPPPLLAVDNFSVILVACLLPQKSQTFPITK